MSTRESGCSIGRLFRKPTAFVFVMAVTVERG
jgi:hypothetical protein